MCGGRGIQICLKSKGRRQESETITTRYLFHFCHIEWVALRAGVSRRATYPHIPRLHSWFWQSCIHYYLHVCFGQSCHSQFEPFCGCTKTASKHQITALVSSFHVPESSRLDCRKNLKPSTARVRQSAPKHSKPPSKIQNESKNWKFRTSTRNHTHYTYWSKNWKFRTKY